MFNISHTHTTPPAPPAPPPGCPAPARCAPACRPSPGASPIPGSSAAGRRRARRSCRPGCRFQLAPQQGLPLPSILASCTGGQGTVPYEQNTQQSPTFGFRTLTQFGQSKKYWQASVGISSTVLCPHIGHVITEFISINSHSLLWDERDFFVHRSRKIPPAPPTPQRVSLALVRRAPAGRPSPGASLRSGSSAADLLARRDTRSCA